MAAIEFQGVLLRHTGEAKEAEALLREAAGYEDGLAQTHYQLGVLLEQEGRLDDAVSELTGAATRDPAYAEPHYALARISGPRSRRRCRRRAGGIPEAARRQSRGARAMIAASVFVVTLLTTIALAPPHPAGQAAHSGSAAPDKPCSRSARCCRATTSRQPDRRQCGLETAPGGPGAP